MIRLTLLCLICGAASAASLVDAKTLADGTLFSDKVARRAGDLVTIMIRETTSVSESQSTEHGRSNSASIGGSYTLPSEDVADIPALSFDTETEFEGEGTYSQQGTISATLTGRVLDVLDNGNLVIEARRTLEVNRDSKTIVLTGIVRTDDISPSNTVMSEKIHNFQVGIQGEGPLTRQQQRGLLGRLIDVIWPL